MVRVNGVSLLGSEILPLKHYSGCWYISGVWVKLNVFSGAHVIRQYVIEKIAVVC